MSDNTPTLEPAQLRGFALVADVVARALAQQPDVEVVGAVQRVADALGDDRFADVRPGDELDQRFFNRFVVTSSPYYLPLVEGSVREAYEEDGVLRYGPLRSKHSDHVLACYRSVRFDHGDWGARGVVARGLKPDALACELEFMASLAQAACDGATEEEREAAQRLLARFAGDHAARWFGRAAGYAARIEDDFYARLVALAAESVEALAEAA
ncbi:molecular chaperone TorD family protein [Adlercreutzia faecimuris]|uniref:Molecular chaperone TorD family protein n=1 Tax=Adlercreutzia faecimuris TaxID=2897341 RepID=A0ABS9WEY2_9ACTN|nr:molecular chaperone TorD family protein [Adlercreutzia sp. JBNU-10]MCI2240862.1 molecular chaperone TorD family protein [Adlercreutzia sp. JBNU-10]